MAEAVLSQFAASPANTAEECDQLLAALLRIHSGEGRWKKIQAGFAKRANIVKSLAWLKNRSKKVGEDDVIEASQDEAAQFSEEVEQAIGIGARVQVHGLQSVEGQSLNGAFGYVVSLDPLSLRCGVDIEHVGRKSIRRLNLTVTESETALSSPDPYLCSRDPHHKKLYTHHDMNAFFGCERGVQIFQPLLKVLRTKAHGGDVRAIFSIAHLHDRGELLCRRDAVLAAKYFFRVAAHSGSASLAVGNSLGCLDDVWGDLVKKLGVRMPGDGDEYLFSASLVALTVKFPQSSVKAHASLVLSEMYYTGDGLQENEGEAATWLKSAAELGHPEAQKKLASWYFYGDVVKRSHRESQRWTMKAAESGHPYSQFLLYSMYGSGECKGVEVDFNLANKWLHAAAHGGEPEAQYILGAHYGNGTLMCKRSLARSLYWHRKSGAQEHARAIASVQEWAARSDKEKSQADEAYDSGDMKEALHMYSHALDMAIGDRVRMKVLLSSISSAHLFLNHSQLGAEKALHAAEVCVQLDAEWAEGYLRCGFALLALGAHSKAKQMLSTGALLDPKCCYFKIGTMCAEEGFTGRLSEIIPRCTMQIPCRHGSKQQVQCETSVMQVAWDWIIHAEQEFEHATRILKLIEFLSKSDDRVADIWAKVAPKLPQMTTSSASIGQAQDEIKRKRRQQGQDSVTEDDRLNHQQLCAQVVRSICAIKRKVVKDASAAVNPANLERLVNCRRHCMKLYEDSLHRFPAQVIWAASINIQAACVEATCYDLGGEHSEALEVMSRVLEGFAWSDEREMLRSAALEYRETLAEAFRVRGTVYLHMHQPEQAVRDAEAAVGIAAVDMGELKPLLAKAVDDCVVCKDCCETMPRACMKRHLKKECPKRMYECDCGDRFCFSAYEAHKAHECATAQISCLQCLASVNRSEMDEHLAELCPLRVVFCPSFACQWQGTAECLQSHSDVCPFAKCECPYCFVELDQIEMCAHVCSTVQIPPECVLCRDPFQSLIAKDCPPSVLLLGSKRACSHGYLVCISCACQVKNKRNGQHAFCPFCKTEYDTVTALALNLIEDVPTCAGMCESAKVGAYLQHRDARPQVPRAEDCFVGSVRWVSPLDVRFTHNNIKESFKPFRRSNGDEVTDKGILTSLKELFDGNKPSELDMLDVVLHGGQIYVAGTGNRRLCMWRLLTICDPVRFRQMKVRFADRRHVRDWDQKFSTECEGRWVEIRPKRYVGMSRDGDEKIGDPGVLWPEAQELLSSIAA